MPVMSALTSTLVCGCTWPLAVTEATRSRVSHRLDADFGRLVAALRGRQAADGGDDASTTAPTIDSFTRLLMIYVSVGSVSAGDGRPRFRARRTPVVFVDGVDAVGLRALVRRRAT